MLGLGALSAIGAFAWPSRTEGKTSDAVGSIGSIGKGSEAPRTLRWQTSDVDPHWHAALRAAGEFYPIKEGVATSGEHTLFIRLRDEGECAGSIRLESMANPSQGGTAMASPRVTMEAHRHFPIGRLIAWALADRVAEGVPVNDRPHFERRGIMFDLARNAALRPEALKRWFAQMFLMGYNHACLYLEDLLAIEGEPYFGYLRGRYTEAELRQIDADGAAFGIEVTASIQTLSHLAQVLKWPAYKKIKRNAHTVITGLPETYRLIEKMVDLVSRSIRSRRIHVGMDESTPISLADFQSHLAKVQGICKERGYTDVDIWSDMYFRINSRKHDYYDKEITFPDAMRGCVPAGVNLVYWDYNTFDEEFYAQWMDKHRELTGGRAPTMAAGLWTWRNSFWYSQRRVESTVTPAMAASRRSGVQDVLFTMWRDDGAYCHYESTLGGLSYAADRCFANDQWSAQVFDAAVGVPYAAVVALSSIDASLFPTMIAWDDPLIGVAHKMFRRVDVKLLDKVAEEFAAVLEKMAPLAEVHEPIDFAYGHGMLRYLREKIVFQQQLDRAYTLRDRSAIGSLAATMPELIRHFEQFLGGFRRQWKASNRPFGLEVMQARFGCQLLRLQDTQERLEAYAQGAIERLEELEEEIEPALPRGITGEFSHLAIDWKSIYTAC